jgi:hypothetical protein
MKKALLAALAAITLSVSAYASDAALWEQYGVAKTEARAALADLNAGNTSTAALERALTAYDVVAGVAKDLGRADIVAWNMNNRGYAAIVWFKNATNYDDAMDELRTMKPSPAKAKLIAEVKAEMAATFATIAGPARANLTEAVGVKAVGLQEAVSSNLAFLDWVERFVK